MKEEIKLTTKDGIKVAINYYKNGFDRLLIIAPGWFMTKDSKYFEQISEIFEKDADVMTLDFRGPGHSSGFYTFTRKEENELNTVIDYAKESYKKIYAAGFSLGGALVLNVASKRPGDFSKIIVVSAPSCFEKIENKVWKKEAWLPTFMKYELERWISVRPSFPFGKKTRPIDIVDKITVPTLFVAGEKDPTVCSWHTKLLFDKAVCEKKFELFENCYHAEDLFIQQKERFIKICTDWLFTE